MRVSARSGQLKGRRKSLLVIGEGHGPHDAIVIAFDLDPAGHIPYVRLILEDFGQIVLDLFPFDQGLPVRFADHRPVLLMKCDGDLRLLLVPVNDIQYGFEPRDDRELR